MIRILLLLVLLVGAGLALVYLFDYLDPNPRV
jgi:hypothetical protein